MLLLETSEHTPNPLDHVEEILSSHNWAYSRMADNELMVKIKGKSCDYRLMFIWQENMSALQFCCQFDLAIHPKNIPSTSLALMEMNTDLWMGHFEISRDSLMPSLRHTCLMRGFGQDAGFENIHDLVDIALVQCERFRPVFEILSQNKRASTDILSLAIMETHGES